MNLNFNKLMPNFSGYVKRINKVISKKLETEEDRTMDLSEANFERMLEPVSEELISQYKLGQTVVDSINNIGNIDYGSILRDSKISSITDNNAIDYSFIKNTYSDKSVMNDALITEEYNKKEEFRTLLKNYNDKPFSDYTIYSDLPVPLNLSLNLENSSFSISGEYSYLPQKNKEIEEDDRVCLNSVLSYVSYSDFDKMTSFVNHQKINGRSFNLSDMVNDKNLFDSDTSVLNKAISTFYAQTFHPAQVMKNGEFEYGANLDINVRFSFRDGVYRSNGNYCSAISCLSENGDGTFTLHMAYRGTDNKSRSSWKSFDDPIDAKEWGVVGEYAQNLVDFTSNAKDALSKTDFGVALSKNKLLNSSFAKATANAVVGAANIMKNVAVGSINTLANTGRMIGYVYDAYSDMGQHYSNYEPFEKACLAYAADPKNNVSQIEATGHSLGGAMVQRFLKSDAVQNNALGDSIKGYTFGAPQTHANMLGKVLVSLKRTVGKAVNYVERKHIDLETSFLVDDKDISKVSISLPKEIFVVTPIATIAPIKDVFLSAFEGIHNTSVASAKVIKNIGVYALVLSNKLAKTTFSLFQSPEVKDVERVWQGEEAVLSQFSKDVEKTKSVIPNISNYAQVQVQKLQTVWNKLIDKDSIEKTKSENLNLIQVFHNNDLIPKTTTLVSANYMGKRVKYHNYVRESAMLANMVEPGNKKKDHVIVSGYSEAQKEYGLIRGTLKVAKDKFKDWKPTLSEHSMGKYVVNSMFRQSIFRRSNMNTTNPRFSNHSNKDLEWLISTPNIGALENALFSLRVEDVTSLHSEITVYENMLNKKFPEEYKERIKQDIKDLKTQLSTTEVINKGEQSKFDIGRTVTNNRIEVVNKLNELYGDSVSYLNPGPLKITVLSDAYNQPAIDFNKLRTRVEIVQDRKEEMKEQRGLKLATKEANKALEKASLESKNDITLISNVVERHKPQVLNKSQDLQNKTLELVAGRKIH